MCKILTALILQLSVLFGQNCMSKVQADSLIHYAKKYLGTRYKYASIDPKRGFDCSGFTFYVFQKFGFKVPRSSIEYEKFGKNVAKDSAKPGDIIVFRGTNLKNKRAGHVGIVVITENNDVTFIHSSSNKTRGGVILSNFKDSPYYEKRFIRICRFDDCQ